MTLSKEILQQWFLPGFLIRRVDTEDYSVIKNVDATEVLIDDVFNGKDPYHCKIDEMNYFEPIPITPELCDKLGAHVGDGEILFSGGWTIENIEGKEGYFVVDAFGTTVREITFIHEIQGIVLFYTGKILALNDIV